MANIVDLPIEVLLLVIEAAETKKNESLKALRRVSRLLATLVEPFLFRNVIFDSGYSKLDTSLNLLTCLSNESRIARHVRNITIRCFDRLWAEELHCYDPIKSRETQERFRLGLDGAFGSGGLARLRSVQVYAGSDSLATSGVWSSLQRNQIPLKEIIVWTKIETPLIDYLDSYSGLEELTVQKAWASPNEEASLTERFSGSALPRHAATLRMLTVTSEEEGLWSLGRHNVNDLGACVNMERLSISINSEEIGLDSEGNDIVTLSLIMANRLPRLESLSLCTSESKRYGGSSGWRAGDHKPHTVALMEKRVLDFQLSFERVSRSPTVEIDGQVFKRADEDEVYRPSVPVEEVRVMRWRKQRTS
ncbi:hypothetical protein PQX77_022212 [Marasmius sp. AFHP31]|nr:hypothetical protein PQX77_022212 [Marasmius sp. AFHP31]